MTVERIRQLIAEHNLHEFYTCTEWLALRAEVLREDHGECQIHKRKGLYKRATTVHHVNHLKRRPDLALSKEYMDVNGEMHRNLLSVCKDCHETECHPERLRKSKPPLTPERW